MAHSRTSILEIVPYTKALAGEWDCFVRNHSRNGGIFHERNFLEYHPVDRFLDVSLVLRTDNKIVGVLPAARQETEQGWQVVSHPGSSAGGLVYQRQHGLREVLEMLESVLHYYREVGVRSLEFRLAEPIFSDPGDGEFTYLLWHRGFRLATREISSCVDLRAGASWEQFGRKKNCNDIRRLKRQGVKSVLLDDPAEIYSLIEGNLDNRYAKRPTHELVELAELKRRYPERLHFWAALHEGKPIATVVAFVVNQTAIHDFYIAMDYAYSRLQVMPLLFYDIFEYYQGQGFKWFNFGISSRNAWIKWGILEFKERMGGRATFRDVWKLDNLQDYQAYCNDER